MQTRECGDCNLCCKLPYIKNFKPQYKWCNHCDIGVGCKIYEKRPELCKTLLLNLMIDQGIDTSDVEIIEDEDFYAK